MTVRIPQTASSRQRCLVCKESKNLHVVSFEDRRTVFNQANIFIPNGSRTCSDHRIRNCEDLRSLRVISDYSSIDIDEMRQLLKGASSMSLFDRVKRLEISDDHFKNLCGFSRENFIKIAEALPTLRNSKSRTAAQALFVFLFKLRTGNSNAVISSLLEIPRAQAVSSCFSSVQMAFERDVLHEFGS